MATEKPRFTITMEPELLEQVENYRYKNSFKTQSKAIIDLVRSGLNELGVDGINEKAPSLSDEAMKVARDYQALDRWGRQVVRSVIDDEMARVEDDKRFLDNVAMTAEPKVINLFLNPSAAGVAMGVTTADCVPYELKADEPQGAAYAVRLQGDSMEPDFPDGSIVFVNHDQMRDGDIGIFCVDGATVCKQWHYDAVLGITYLFSLNRKRDDADVVVTRNSGRSLVWQGRVITKRRYDLPGM